MRDLVARHKIFFGTIVFLILVTIPLTVLQVQQQQNLRQRAAPVDSADIGIRLCASGPVVNNLSACNSKVQGANNWAVKIMAVNNSGEPVDVSAFDLDLEYDSRYIKSLSVDRRNDYNYSIILPGALDQNLVNNTGRVRIVGVNNTSSPRIIGSGEIIMLASIHVEPNSSIGETGLDITSNTKIAVNGVKTNARNHATDQANARFTMTVAPTVAQVTVAPTATPIPGTPPTATPVPGAPTATSTPIPQGTTAGSFTIDLDGIVDNPSRKNRKLNIQIFDPEDNNKKIADATVDINHDATSKRFKGAGVLESVPKSGIYNMKVKSDGYLRKLILSVRINKGGQIDIPQVKLIPGDIDGDNRIDIKDYNLFVTCYGTKSNLPTCDKTVLKLADFDDNIVIDGIDYNTFIKGLSVKEGD